MGQERLCPDGDFLVGKVGGDGEMVISGGKARSQVLCAEKPVLGGAGKLEGPWE